MTASLCRITWGGVAANKSQPIHDTLHELKCALVQFPGRFCVPQSMELSLSTIPGRPMPIKDASARPAFYARRMAASSISNERIRGGITRDVVLGMTHISRSLTLASANPAGLPRLKFTIPVRILVPPISTARRAL